MDTPVIAEILNLSKSYDEGGRSRRVLDDVSARFYEGEFFVMLGKSGSGKSTLLNMLSAIDSPDSGHVLIEGTDITRLGDTAQTLFRRDNIGIIFQFFNLIPTLTVLENITLPRELRGDGRGQSERRARQLLERVGLDDREDAFPDALSGGEQQRVAIARALAHEPKLLLADEPTGNLDAESGQRIVRLLLELTREARKTLIMATHNPEILPFADRVCRIHAGKLTISAGRSSGHATDVAAPAASRAGQ